MPFCVRFDRLMRSRLSFLTFLIVVVEGSANPSANMPIDSSTHQVVSSILEDIESWQEGQTSQDPPFVTLAFAQSLDGKIALRNMTDGSLSSNLPLSGMESLILTHGLRSIHDAILVGGKTLCTDNPRLSNRLRGDGQPRPVVLDTRLVNVRKLGSSRRVQNAIVCCSVEAAQTCDDQHELPFDVLPCHCDENGKLILSDVLRRLQSTYGINSIMVEGGAALHSAFMTAQVVDCLCVTIAPKILGNDRGLACFSSTSESDADKQQDYIDLAASETELRLSRFLPLGKDCIYLCRWPTQS